MRTKKIVLPASLKKDLQTATKQWQQARNWYHSAGQAIAHKTEEYNALPEKAARYESWIREDDEQVITQLWINQAAETRVTHDAGLDAYLAETRETAAHDQERLTCQGREHAESVLDSALAIARVLGHTPERPQVTDPWTIGELPFLDGTLESFCQSLDADKRAKAAAKATARENIPAFILPAYPHFGNEGPTFRVIAGNLLSACSHKDENGREVLTPDDSILFTDVQPAKGVPAIARRTLKGWLEASAFAPFDQLILTLAPHGLIVWHKNEQGRVTSRATFLWTIHPKEAALRPVQIREPVTSPHLAELLASVEA